MVGASVLFLAVFISSSFQVLDILVFWRNDHSTQTCWIRDDYSRHGASRASLLSYQTRAWGKTALHDKSLFTNHKWSCTDNTINLANN